MRLTEILKPANIKLGLDATNKQEAITALVNVLRDNGELLDAGRVLDAVMEREATRTTGIGAGLAIPHGKCTGVDRLVCAIGRVITPIDFQAIDGRPVSLIWLLASPPDKTGPHISALAQISRLMTNAQLRNAILAAATEQDVYDLIQKQELSM
jgi:mannitol/fructose-specific phosphotransferase system IIA component (Ntr-type)